MEDSRSGVQKKQRIHLNLGETGSAIGVGVIFVGGVLATAALVANILHRRLPKPTNKDNNNNLIRDRLGKPSEEGDTGDIPAQNFLPNGEHKFEVSHGKEDLKCEDEEISSCIQDFENRSVERDGYIVDKEIVTDPLLHQPDFCSLKDISCITVELPKQDDRINKADSDQGTEESNQLNQLQTEEDENNCCTYGQETDEVNIIMISTNGERSACIDHDSETKRDTDTTSVCISLRDLGNSSLDNEEILNIDHEVDSIDFKMVEADKMDEISDATVILEENSELSQEDDMLALGSIEVPINEILETAYGRDGKSHTTMFTSENKEKVCSHSDDLFTVETLNKQERDKTCEADQGDGFDTSAAIQSCEEEVKYSQFQVVLTTAAAEVLEAPELQEAPKGENQPDIPSPEEKEAQPHSRIEAAIEVIEDGDKTNAAEGAGMEKEAQNDAQIDAAEEAAEEKEAQHEGETHASQEAAEEKEAQHNGQRDAAGAAVEEKEAQYDAQTDALEETSEEKEAQRDAQTAAAAEAVEEKEAQRDAQTDVSGQAAKYDSSSMQAKNFTESPGILDQAYNLSSHGMIFQNIVPQKNEQSSSFSALAIDTQFKHVAGIKNDLKEASSDHHSSNLKIDNFATETAIEDVDDNSTLMPSTVSEENLQELQDIYPTSDYTETTIEDHLVAEIKEEDEVQREEENTGSQPMIVDKVEESSEGSVESSTESMSESVWPAEVIQETPMQPTEEEVIKIEKQKLEENGEDLTLQTMGKEAYSAKIKNGDSSSKSLQFINNDNRSSKMNLLKKLVVQGDGEKSFLLRQRAPALRGALLTLLWHLCSWYFDLPFLKVCLIAILVMVLFKTQGF